MNTWQLKYCNNRVRNSRVEWFVFRVHKYTMFNSDELIKLNLSVGNSVKRYCDLVLLVISMPG